MGILDNLKEKVQNWFVGVVGKKVLRTVAGVVVAFLLSAKIAPYLQQLGVTINQTELEAGLTALFAGGMEWLRTVLKAKFNLTFL